MDLNLEVVKIKHKIIVYYEHGRATDFLFHSYNSSHLMQVYITVVHTSNINFTTMTIQYFSNL